jgi:hypothetical protein
MKLYPDSEFRIARPCEAQAAMNNISEMLSKGWVLTEVLPDVLAFLMSEAVEFHPPAEHQDKHLHWVQFQDFDPEVWWYQDRQWYRYSFGEPGTNKESPLVEAVAQCTALVQNAKWIGVAEVP